MCKDCYDTDNYPNILNQEFVIYLSENGILTFLGKNCCLVFSLLTIFPYNSLNKRARAAEMSH